MDLMSKIEQKTINLIDNIFHKAYTWRPSSLSKLTPIIFNMELTHLGLEASIL